MARSKQESVLASVPDMEALKRFILLLNIEEYWPASLIEGRQKVGGDYRPVQKELRRLVREWFNSGPNVSKLLDADPMVDRAARDFRPHFVPTKRGTARLAYLTVPEYLPQVKPLEIALGLFLNFLINLNNERLGGPCKHCGNYYVKNTKRQVEYCSERCGHKHTSQTVIRKNRQQEHKENLEKAKRSSVMWAKNKRSKDWKEWVSNDTQISKHWLTRAVRKGELVVPVKHI
jgi:hypothetical protein